MIGRETALESEAMNHLVVSRRSLVVRSRALACLALIAGLSGCGHGCRAGPPGPPAGGSGADELGYLEGDTQAQVIESLGEPAGRGEFAMSECCSEFEVELHNTYRPGDPNNVNVRIRQLDWAYDGYRVTVWFHQPAGEWVALETSRYSDGIEF